MPETVAQLVDRAQAGLRTLEACADPITDELQYVTDLGVVWGARLRAVADARGTELASPAASLAIDTLAEEAALIQDPHRAIDWLSTYPQVALAALGERA